MEEISSTCTSTSDGTSSKQTSMLLGKYEVGKLVGHGSFAKVYHARDMRTGQSVAIKAVSKQKVIKGGFVGHVKTEILIMRRLRHPHVTMLLEVLATKSKIYLVMEFAKGGELFSKVAKGRFSEDLSRRYFQQLIAAIGYCHTRGVYHRDLKPENLLLDENWNLKVSDFGLGAVKDTTTQPQPELVDGDGDGLLHTLCGTPAYVAPEILGKKGYDGAKVDIWSCGVILFVLNAGYLPFNDTNLMAMYKKIYKGAFRCPKWTSPDLQGLLSRLLDTNPDTRMTIDEILVDPWFKKDYKDVEFHVDDFGPKDCTNEDEYLNAFDLISFSPGFDLSNMFQVSQYVAISTSNERFLSSATPSSIVERVVEVAKAENVTVLMKKDNGVQLQGQYRNFIIDIKIYWLTEHLVVVEVNQRKVKVLVGTSLDFWKDKLKPQIHEFNLSPN